MHDKDFSLKPKFRQFCSLGIQLVSLHVNIFARRSHKEFWLLSLYVTSFMHYIDVSIYVSVFIFNLSSPSRM